MSITPNYFNTSADMAAATSPYRPAPSARLDRGLHHLFINLLWRLQRRQSTSFVTLARLGALPRQPTFTSIAMPSLHCPSGNGCADRVPILGVTFLRTAITNKPGAINPSIFCLFGFIFPRNYYSGLSIICTQVYQMMVALTTVAW